MTFLPIVNRELRVASRHQFTYWSRPVAAGFTLIIFGFLILFLTLASGAGISAGTFTFTILGWLAFIFACSAGVFLTSDSLSEEKREGTLGLLFLTDLRGYDIVLGKLMSQSLLSIYALVAAFPILALPLMLGGVTGAQFGRELLVIGNTLFLSLAIGLFVSSISRDVVKAMTLTLIISLVFLAGLPWLDLGLAHWDQSKFECITSIASPGYLFSQQQYMRPHEFRSQLGIQHGIAWVFLAAACVCVPRAWQEKSNNSSGWRRKFAIWWNFGGKRGRIALRRKLFARNPLRWLAARDRSLRRWIWLAVMLTLWGAAQTLVDRWLGQPRNDNFTFFQYLLTLLLFLWVATQACRFFVDATRNGAMELILVTPATPRQIVQGQWTTLWRMFLIPLLVVLALLITGEMETLLEMRKMYLGMPQSQIPQNYMSIQTTTQVVGMVSGVLTVTTDFVALAWFGMWMGMKSRKTSIAALKTIGFVAVLPWLVEMMLYGGIIVGLDRLSSGPMGTSRVLVSQWSELIGSLAATVVALGKNFFFILWPRHKLLTALRVTAALGGQPRHRRIFRRAAIAAAPAPSSLAR